MQRLAPVVLYARITTTGEVFRADLRTQRKSVRNFAVMASGVAVAPTTLTSALEVSLNGSNWTSAQAITQANNNTVLFVVDKPAQLFRINVSALTLGSATAVDFYLLGVE